MDGGVEVVGAVNEAPSLSAVHGDKTAGLCISMLGKYTKRNAVYVSGMCLECNKFPNPPARAIPRACNIQYHKSYKNHP